MSQIENFTLQHTLTAIYEQRFGSQKSQRHCHHSLSACNGNKEQEQEYYNHNHQQQQQQQQAQKVPLFQPPHQSSSVRVTMTVPQQPTPHHNDTTLIDGRLVVLITINDNVDENEY